MRSWWDAWVLGISWRIRKAQHEAWLMEQPPDVILVEARAPGEMGVFATAAGAQGVVTSPESDARIRMTANESAASGSALPDAANLTAVDATEAYLQILAGPARSPASGRTGERLKGTGVAAGTAKGRVRIRRHPDDGDQPERGEILVAPSTDPGWTPLFLRAATSVMEVGGFHSHGAIVAREFGIPAVANIPGLLSALRDGEVVIVDGDAGEVIRTGN